MAVVPTIRMGTTPTQKYTLGLETLAGCKIIITYSQRETILFERSEEEVEITDNVIVFALTQRETLMLRTDCDLEIQVRVLSASGTAFNSKRKHIKVLPSYNREVMV